MKIIEEKAISFDFAVSGNFCDICAAVIYDGKDFFSWPKALPSGKTCYKDKLNHLELTMVVHALTEYLDQGYKIYGWGSLGFDLKLLYQEGVVKQDVVRLAYSHYDYMFQIFSEIGVMASLYGISNIYPIVDQSFSKSIPTLWKSQDIQKQDQVLQHLVEVTQRIYNLYGLVNPGMPIRWEDYRRHYHGFGQNPKPCHVYLEHALCLPPVILHNKWTNTFDWIRQAEKEKTEDLFEIPEVSTDREIINPNFTLAELPEIPF